MKKLLLLVCVFSSCVSFAQIDSVIISNKSISRKFYFRVDSLGFFTKELLNKTTAQNYVNPGTEEFSLTIDDTVVTGLNCHVNSHHFEKNGDTSRLAFTLRTPLEGIYIELIYELYENIPACRKFLNVTNVSTREVSLTNLDVEMLRMQVVNKYSNEVYTHYGTSLTRIPYKGDYNDAVIMLYNAAEKQGVILGNEAPSILKSTEIYSTVHGRIQIGMTHLNDAFPFKKVLQPHDTFHSPAAFILAFSSPQWTDGFEGDYKKFVLKYLGLRSAKQKALSFYCTWIPFMDHIDESILRSCTDHLAGTGTNIFIIDAGWYLYSGDFLEDSIHFPSGLKAMCDYLRQKGMQPGLWFAIASANEKSKVATEHPGWLIKGKDGKAANLHDMAIYPDGSGFSGAMKTISLASPYYDHLKALVNKYIEQLHLEYIKLDLSMIASAYVHEPARSGDYETNSSKLYKDRESSYWAVYERALQLIDDLHQLHPHLLIDLTFESWGRYNATDFAIFQHADYEWLANIELDSIKGPIHLRQMNFDRSRAIPNAGFIIGNMLIQSKNYKYVYFSLASANIVFLGDPRRLSTEQQKFYLKWNSYLAQFDKRYHYTQYFQLYDVFDRPSESNWDGCYRINTDEQAGLLFFYRNNSPDKQRTFRIPCLLSENNYRIYSHETGKVIGHFTGKQLAEKGISVTLPNAYSGTLLTIEKE